MHKKHMVLFSLTLLILSIVPFIFYKRNNTKKENIDTTPLVRVSGDAIKVIENCGNRNDDNPTFLEAYGFTTISLRAGDTNDLNKPIIKEVKTNKEGAFSISLPPGTYCAVFSDKANPNVGDAKEIDTNCYQDYISECDAILNVGDKDLNNVVLTFKNICNNKCIKN